MISIKRHTTIPASSTMGLLLKSLRMPLVSTILRLQALAYGPGRRCFLKHQPVSRCPDFRHTHELVADFDLAVQF
jgi:hypothetical protein